MAQFMVPLMRSGALWSCSRTARLDQRRGFWTRVLRWFSGDPEHPPISLVFRSSALRRGTRRY